MNEYVGLGDKENRESTEVKEDLTWINFDQQTRNIFLKQSISKFPIIAPWQSWILRSTLWIPDFFQWNFNR